MKECFFKSLAVAALATAGFASQAMATVINFDQPDAKGIVNYVNQTAVPIFTQGFTFSSNMDVIDTGPGTPWLTGSAHSGLFSALNDWLSLIHISEPTRRTPISYAVFCLK